MCINPPRIDRTGSKHTEETKTIIKEKRRLQIISDETREKHRKNMMGNNRNQRKGFEVSEKVIQSCIERNKARALIKKEELTKIRELRETMTFTAIAKIYNVDRKVISNFLERHKDES